MATTVEPTTSKLAEPRSAAAPGTAWYKNQRVGAIGGGLVALAALGFWFVTTSAKRKEAFAAQSLEQARATAESGNLPAAASQLQRIIDGFGGTRASEDARLALNSVRIINGQSELAVVGLREYIAQGPSAEFRAPAYSLLGTALENSKRFAEAGEAYRNASEATTVAYLKAEYLVEAGRAFRLGSRPAEAATAYRTVVEQYKDSPLFTEAQVRLAELTDGKM